MEYKLEIAILDQYNGLILVASGMHQSLPDIIMQYNY